MNYDEKLKEIFLEMAEITSKKLPEIMDIKSKVIKSQDFEEAVKINLVEKSLLDFLVLSDTYTDFKKKKAQTDLINKAFNKI